MLTDFVVHKLPGETKDVLFRFPTDQSRREQWLKVLGLKASDITKTSCICSWHFLSGDSPSLDMLEDGLPHQQVTFQMQVLYHYFLFHYAEHSSPQLSPSSSTVDVSEADNPDTN